MVQVVYGYGKNCEETIRWLTFRTRWCGKTPWTLEPGSPGFCLLCCWLTQSAMLLLSPSLRFFSPVNWLRAEAPPVGQALSCLSSSNPHTAPRSRAFVVVPFCRGGYRLSWLKELAWSPRAGNGWAGFHSQVCLNLFFVIPGYLPLLNIEFAVALYPAAWQSD